MANIVDHLLYYLRKPKTVLIHVGKCGGGTLQKTLARDPRKIRFYSFHVEKPIYRNKDQYYILARDPISRSISAFNWRYKLVVESKEQVERFPGEYQALSKYKSLNRLAECLYDDNGSANHEAIDEFNSIHHLKENISFHLTEFLKKCPAGNIKGVLMQESLNADMEKFFSVDNEKIGYDKRNPSKVSSELSLRARKNLVRYLEDDYHCLFKLHNLGLINDQAMLNIYQNAFLQDKVAAYG
ncbi:hypothetical protein FE810_03225 [Thalassotalea litorea]|uniref:Sulfotransferase family protein n=1 Tax=Thalassotalea litorea TaxID=2020715 RepID=A0A5R9IRR1_9GAMM|nr:hypothetical protein [Thalassotalea litorea]TLU67309.1 hypothetical protein FE810_03225 [Thalassotalea litorea]